MKNSISVQEYQSPAGVLMIGSYKNKLCLCDWKYRKQRGMIDQRIQNFFQAEFEENSSEVISQTILQLRQYFNDERDKFHLSIAFAGTQFQQKVWRQLLQIPFGSTETYRSLSRKLGDEKAVRAVASANGANAISIIVPCHRIIGSNGDLVGYAGGLQAKRKLLELEAKSFQQNLFD